MIPYLDSSLDIQNGIYVVQISQDGAAAKSGLQEGDIISKIDLLTLNKMCDLRSYIYTKNPGDEVTLTVQRKSREVEIKVKLGQK